MRSRTQHPWARLIYNIHTNILYFLPWIFGATDVLSSGGFCGGNRWTPTPMIPRTPPIIPMYGIRIGQPLRRDQTLYERDLYLLDVLKRLRKKKVFNFIQ